VTWNTTNIRTAFEEGNTGKYSHMLVAYDSFDGENYPIYVPQGRDPKSYIPSNGDRVDECYSYQLGWTVQAVERRALHWDWVSSVQPLDPREKKIDLTKSSEIVSGLQTVDEFLEAAAQLGDPLSPTDHLSVEEYPAAGHSLEAEDYPTDSRAELESLRFLVAQAYADLSAHGSPSGLVFDVRQLLQSTPAEIHGLISEQRAELEEREARIEEASAHQAEEQERIAAEDQRIAEDRAELQAAAELVAAREAELRAEGWDQGAQATRVHLTTGSVDIQGRIHRGPEPVNPHRPR